MVFPVFYFGPISYFQEILKAENLKFEIQESFPKQTYRNRCFIQGANGKLRLAIPIRHDGSRQIKDLRVSSDTEWQKEHFKSIVSAYKSSPFFDYYEEELKSIYDTKSEFLLEFNLRTLEFIKSKLKLNFDIQFTENYEDIPLELDFRKKFNSKIVPTKSDFREYVQVFNEKLGFMPDLSILDLLCNEGPNATTYLREVVDK